MSASVRDYRDLVAWQRVSVQANIAEGNGRLTLPDYLRHLGISNASLSELESDLFFVSKRHPHQDVTRSLELVLLTRKPLCGLISALRKKKKDGH